MLLAFSPARVFRSSSQSCAQAAPIFGVSHVTSVTMTVTMAPRSPSSAKKKHKRNKQEAVGSSSELWLYDRKWPQRPQQGNNKTLCSNKMPRGNVIDRVTAGPELGIEGGIGAPRKLITTKLNLLRILYFPGRFIALGQRPLLLFLFRA